MVLFRVMQFVTTSMFPTVRFEGTLEHLRREFPRDRYPGPINRHVEDVLAGRGGSILLTVQRAELLPKAQLGARVPEELWKVLTEDPRDS